MSDDGRMDLSEGKRVTLDAAGFGRIEIGPESKGAQNWRVTTVILKTSRPGNAPIPRCELWLDQQTEATQKGLTYDGSFKSGSCDFGMSRGQTLIAEWSGGQQGDIAMITVTGDKW